MAKFGLERVIVSFDDGTEVDVQTTSRDLLRLEREGIALHKLGALEGFYTLAYAGLCRLKDKGGEFDLPISVEVLMDVADITVIEDDPKALSQEATTA